MSTNPKKVLFLAPQPFFQWRGSPIRVGFDVQALAELGYEVDLLTLPIGLEKKIPGVRIFRVPNLLGVKNVPIGPSPAKAFFDVLILFRALALGLRNRYDVIHAVEETGVIAWFVAKLIGARVVFEKHSDPASHKDKPLKNLILSIYRRVEAFAIRHADAVIATGEGLMEQAKLVDQQKTVYHIFDIPSSLVEPTPEKVAVIRRQLLKNPGEVLILYVGSFAVYQGIDLMFETMPFVIKQRPHARFIIIGGSDEEVAARKKWLHSHGIESSVSFIGKVHPDGLPDYLAAVDILLSPRLSGINTPLKLLDYLKAGRAIVATENPANRRILSDQVAVLVPPNAKAFVDGIDKLIGNEELRMRLGERGRRLIDELYNYEEFKRRLKACYEGL